MTVVIPNQLYSFHYSQVPGFERLYELSRQHSYAPKGFDAKRYESLAPDHSLFARRATLCKLPNEEPILARELELADPKSVNAPHEAPRDVETPDLRRSLASLLARPENAQLSSAPRELVYEQLKHRVGSGYVKLDDRKSRLADLIAAVSELLGAACRCQGDYWYPSGGFRDWHTNKYDTPGWRLYIVDVDASGKSYFRIKHPKTNEIVTLWDQPGTFNFFLIDPNRLLWHCIGAEGCNRWSKGFVVPDTWLETIVRSLN